MTLEELTNGEPWEHVIEESAMAHSCKGNTVEVRVLIRFRDPRDSQGTEWRAERVIRMRCSKHGNPNFAEAK
jgi:hypothetical protein